MEYIAIDIGGTKIKSGVIDFDGTIISTNSYVTPKNKGSEYLLGFIKKIIKEQINENTKGIGISTLGVVDVKKGMVTGSCDNLPELAGIPLRDELESEFKLSVNVMNDVNAAAQGEACFGAGKGLEQFYCLTLGTGIGGAYVYEGKVICGANGQAGEIGYLYGWQGCDYETKASVKAFLASCKECETSLIDDDELFKNALDGESQHSELFENWIENVAIGIVELIYMYDPGVVVVGGGVSYYKEKLTGKIEEKVNNIIVPIFKSKTKIIPATKGNSASLLGTIAKNII